MLLQRSLILMKCRQEKSTTYTLEIHKMLKLRWYGAFGWCSRLLWQSFFSTSSFLWSDKNTNKPFLNLKSPKPDTKQNSMMNSSSTLRVQSLEKLVVEEFSSFKWTPKETLMVQHGTVSPDKSKTFTILKVQHWTGLQLIKRSNLKASWSSKRHWCKWWKILIRKLILNDSDE